MATIKQKKAAKAVVENGGNVSKAMVTVGYSKATAKTPQKLTKSKGWQELMKEYLSDTKLAKKHDALLNAHRIEHMVFPLNVTDDEIKELLSEVNCVARRFMHSETQTHVWFWSPDNASQLKALDSAYKLKGSYAPEKSVNMNLNVEGEVKNKKAQKIAEDYEKKLRALIEKGDE